MARGMDVPRSGDGRLAGVERHGRAGRDPLIRAACRRLLVALPGDDLPGAGHLGPGLAARLLAAWRAPRDPQRQPGSEHRVSRGRIQYTAVDRGSTGRRPADRADGLSAAPSPGGAPSGGGGSRSGCGSVRRHDLRHVQQAPPRPPRDGCRPVRRVLHLIPILNFGGASRAAINAAATVAGEDEAHLIASIRPALRGMATVAQTRGVEVLDAPPISALMEAIATADITLVHLWNSPELLEVLESDLPPCRLLVWAHVAGHTAPQVLPPSIFKRACETVATSHLSARWVQAARPEHTPVVIPPVGGWERFDGVARSSLPGFNVGYVGAVAFTRMHSDFVRMNLAVELEGARFIV